MLVLHIPHWFFQCHKGLQNPIVSGILDEDAIFVKRAEPTSNKGGDTVLPPMREHERQRGNRRNGLLGSLGFHMPLNACGNPRVKEKATCNTLTRLLIVVPCRGSQEWV